MTGYALDRLIEEIIQAGAARGWHEKDILARAGLGKTTLSKIKSAGDTRFSTLMRLCNTVGLQLTLAPNRPTAQQILNRNLFNPEQRPNG